MEDCLICTSTASIVAAVVIAYFVVKWFLSKLTIGDYDQRYVLITGCDMGFGNLLTKRLISMGFNVFAGCLTDKGIADLQEVGSKKLRPFKLDVTKKEDIDKAKETVKGLLPKDKGLWALVNNAGILGKLGMPDLYTREDYEKVLNVNMYGTIEMTMAFLPLLREAEGRIVNVASVAGKVSLPTCIPYCISKYAIEAFSDGMRYSLSNEKVTVHMLEPGLHGTNLLSMDELQKGFFKDFHSAPQETQDYYGEKCAQDYSYALFTMMKMLTSPRLDGVVNAHVHAITAKFPKTRYLVGYDAHLLFWPQSLLPDWLGDFISKQRFCVPIGLEKKKAS